MRWGLSWGQLGTASGSPAQVGISKNGGVGRGIDELQAVESAHGRAARSLGAGLTKSLQEAGKHSAFPNKRIHQPYWCLKTWTPEEMVGFLPPVPVALAKHPALFSALSPLSQLKGRGSRTRGSPLLRLAVHRLLDQRGQVLASASAMSARDPRPKSVGVQPEKRSGRTSSQRPGPEKGVERSAQTSRLFRANQGCWKLKRVKPRSPPKDRRTKRVNARSLEAS